MANSKHDPECSAKPDNVGLLHPGAMGATVGAAARVNVGHVFWASAGRSAATHERAAAAGLEDAGTLEKLVGCCDLLLCICPPAAALEVARRVASTDFRGTYLDANAISPDTMRSIAKCFDPDRVRVVDGGLIGPPARREGTTVLHLSGDAAAGVAACFEAGPLEAHCLDGPVGAASALKMAFAAYTKGSTALLASIYALARAEGVSEPLLAEWAQRVPELTGRLSGGVPAAAVKAWRFSAEMHEIADTFEAVGLPAGFHRAAAELYDRLADFKDAQEEPALDAVADRLIDTRR